MSSEPLRVTKPDPSLPEDVSLDEALRPGTFDEYVGQEGVKRNLRVIVEAARKRDREAMDHLLFVGPAGLGKTTLAYLVAKELSVPITTTSGPALERAGDLAAILTNLTPHEVLFVDEAHRLNRMIEEVLYPAMESRKLHLTIGKGPSARSVSVDLPPFTLVAATTRENLLSQPLRSRFGATFRLEYYTHEEMERIIERSAEILGMGVVPEAVKVLSHASRATPRIANRLLRRSRDYIEVHGGDRVHEEAARKTLELLDVDSAGLEPHDRKLLRLIIEKFGGGPVGLGTLAAALSEERGVIEEIYEPYLMTLGFLKRTSAGRMVLPAAYEHLGVTRRGELV